MSIIDVLREKEEHLAELYRTNLELTRSLQHTLQQDIIPGLVDELGLDADAEERARLWLSDLQSLFQILRRHKFILSFALENARDVLLWRLAVIPPEIPRRASQCLQCLPGTVRDPFGRPVVVINLSHLFENAEDIRMVLIHRIELLRRNLEAVNAEARDNHNRSQERPVLQYVALVDIGGLSVQNMQNVDLVTWFVYELLPRFPGMLAAVFVLNYTWAHSGVWNIVKRALPKSALTRVFFPSQEELLAYFPPWSIPRDYGGSLSALSDLEDPLENYYCPHANGAQMQMHLAATLPEVPNQTNSANRPSSKAAEHLVRIPSISPTSHLNPYYGYPVSGRGGPTPRLRHGRQRKRDLLRTLAGLWWGKWKHRVVLLLYVLVAVVLYRLRRQPRLLSWMQSARTLLHLPGPSRPS